MTNRYHQLADIIAETKPRTIVEIGTHRGARAILMITEALRYTQRVSYVGYDIFEYGGEQFQIDALNAKGTATEAEAINALRRLKERYPDRMRWDLVIGDTRQTLNGHKIVADLVFLDGDHRIETIRSDYEAVRMSRVVVFDDYYVSGGVMPEPDTDIYGSNRLVDDLMTTPFGSGLNVRMLPAEDPSNLGGMIRLVVAERI